MAFLSIQTATASSFNLTTLTARLRTLLTTSKLRTRKTPEQMLAAQARRAEARAATDRLLR
jgi:hypothetical protein